MLTYLICRSVQNFLSILETHFVSEDDCHTGSRNVSRCQQQCYLELR